MERKVKCNIILQHLVTLKDCEYDWMLELSVYALNLSTMQFENCTYLTKDSTIYLNLYYNTADYSEELCEEALMNNADFILYSHEHFAVGYVKIA